MRVQAGRRARCAPIDSRHPLHFKVIFRFSFLSLQANLMHFLPDRRETRITSAIRRPARAQRLGWSRLHEI
jgi:hypothetical protein